MIQEQQRIKFSDHLSLYDILIPHGSLYHQLLSLIDFGSIRSKLAKNYSLAMGHSAIDSMVLFKYLLLKTMHPSSDRALVARSYTDMGYKFFLGLSPKKNVIDSSLQTVFRRQRMKGLDLMDLLLRSSIDKAKTLGLISSRTVIIDATHTISTFKRYTLAEAILRRSHLLIKTLHEAGANKNLFAALPLDPSEKKTAAMVEYAKSLLLTVENSGFPITEGIADSMEY